MAFLRTSVKKPHRNEESVAPEALVQGSCVWCSTAPSLSQDKTRMYSKCVVVEKSDVQNVVLKEVTNPDLSFKAKITDVFGCSDSNDMLSMHDLGLLPYPNPPSVLELLQTRYMNDEIYTLADPLLISINPFRETSASCPSLVPLYSQAMNHQTLNPHVYLIAKRALDSMRSAKENQTILVSGESGAGKTENTKLIMKFLASAAGEVEDSFKPRDLRIQHAVMAANPVLEAFGNAKTVMNDNSSRFGKFMSLEKSRVVLQAHGERNYHIFYQLVKGATEEQRKQFDLKRCNEYALLNSDCIDVHGRDDAADFQEVLEGLKSIGFSQSNIESILSLLAGILLLGNVRICQEELGGMPESARIYSDDIHVFKRACKLLFLDSDMLENCLLHRETKAGSQTIKGRWSQRQCLMLKDSLCKAIYGQLFNLIVKKLNIMIDNPQGIELFIGLLDIFGFEVFERNSLEQLFINVTNELLQSMFVDLVFKREISLYSCEGLEPLSINYETPDEIINLLISKTTTKSSAILSILEDSCLSPGGSDATLAAAVKAQIKKAGNGGALRVTSNMSFTVRHSIGDITYDAEGFVAKNTDHLRAEFVDVINNSDDCIAKELFKGMEVARGKLMKGQLIGSQFTAELNKLIDTIEKTEPHFIRCIKPNDKKESRRFDNRKVLAQLRALSVLEALQLRNKGYAYRRPFAHFVRQYRYVHLPALAQVDRDPRGAALVLLSSTGLLEQKDYCLGKTMVFLSRDAQQRLMGMQQQKLATLRPLVRTLEAVARRQTHKKQLSNHIISLVRLQAHVRRQLLLLEMRSHATDKKLPSKGSFVLQDAL